MNKISNIIFNVYFGYGLFTGFIILPLIMFCIDVFDYSNNKKE